MSSILSSTIALQRDIQTCINDLVTARVRHDRQKECELMLYMESLMCATQQQLQCVIDYLTENETSNN